MRILISGFLAVLLIFSLAPILSFGEERLPDGDAGFSAYAAPAATAFAEAPELARKIRAAREMLARLPLKKEIKQVAVQSSKRKFSRRKPSRKGGQSLQQRRETGGTVTRMMYRVRTAEFAIAAEDGVQPVDEVDGSPESLVAKHPNVSDGGIKKILLREIFPPLGSSGSVFEVIDSDFACELSVEYEGGIGINRRFLIACDDETGEGAQKRFLASSGFYLGKNLFSSRNELEAKIRRITYVPFSEEYATLEIIAYGDLFARKSINAALKKLEAKKVFSRAYPGKSAASITDNKNILFILLLNEHCDHAEFNAWGAEFCVKKTLATIALNEGGVYPTTNFSGAAGAMQFTNNSRWTKNPRKKIPGTYNMVRIAYPEAGLIPEFPAGAYDFENAVMAAALLLDYELSQMPPWVRDAYAKDARSAALCLATAYHSGGGVAANLCGKQTRAVALGAFQYPNRFKRIRPELGYYLRKFIALEKLFSL